MSFRKRKGTRAACKHPENFTEIKEEYLNHIQCVITKYNIPDTLIINWDQTGVKTLLKSEFNHSPHGVQGATDYHLANGNDNIINMINLADV
jgi:hypothetical protein